YVTDNTDCDDTKLLYADHDGDGFGAGSPVACGVDNNSDCNDNDASVHSGITYYRDADGDGFGDPNNSTTVCSSTPPTGYVTNNSDCDDAKLLYADHDGDGYGAGSPVACGVDNNSDCNDNDASVHSPQTYYADNDGDGFGDANNSTTVCSSTPPTGYVTDNTDCNDNVASIHPGAVEICGNGIDDNCNGTIDEDETPPVVSSCPSDITRSSDAGMCGAKVDYNLPTATDNCGCHTPESIPGYLLLGTYSGHKYFISTATVNWTSAKAIATSLGGHLVSIGSAGEQNFLQTATVTQAWIGLTDEVSEGNYSWVTNEPVTYTNWSSGEPNDAGGIEDYAIINWYNGTWNDLSNGYNFPFIVEFDCDGSNGGITITQTSGLPSGSIFPMGTTTNSFNLADESGNIATCSFNVTITGVSTTYYRDADGDGFGDPNNSTTVCSSTPPTGYVTDNTDCDDTKLLYADHDGDGFGAGSPVACGVANNSDCNDNDASVHSPQTYYADNDGDGFGNANNSTTVCSSTPPTGYVVDNTDCDDTKLLYVDNDGDGYGSGSPVACGVANNSDCNDNDASVHTPQTYYADNDGDGFGDANNSISACSSTPPTGYVTNNSDCDDTKLLYADNDGDGYGAGSPVACGVDNNSDCNDNNSSMHPGAVEICGNGIDDNCNGQIDEGCVVPVTISIADASLVEGNSGSKFMRFKVTLNAPANKKVSVYYTTNNGTATAFYDYLPALGKVTFNIGQVQKIIKIIILGDKVAEVDETFTVQLSNPVHATIADGTATGTIINNDGNAITTMPGNNTTRPQINYSVKIYPNPVSNVLTVQFAGVSESDIELQLEDIQGRVLKQSKVKAFAKLAQQKIDVSGLANGVYMLVVVDKYGIKQTEKVVVQR
ncbi:MAG: HYR domain-containing protein, partial [Bacteroidetes bacterium]|nr:HYR domain-containing protein [Bacteroidota bacterium]